jgi:uncharacterized caspase-like protein
MAPIARSRAVLIGIDAYERLPRLRTAVADVTAVADTLARLHGFEVDRWVAAAVTDDRALFYFAGHGFAGTDDVWDSAQDFTPSS